MMNVKPLAVVGLCAMILYGLLGCKNTHPNVLTTPMCFDLSPTEISRYQRKALIGGDGEAAYNLYLYYSLGFVIDDAKAVYWLRKAGGFGNENALHDLKLMGLESDKQENNPECRKKIRFDLSPKEVIRCQEKTLIDGDEGAAYRLYLYYQLGSVIDDARAIYWLRRAGALGSKEALYELKLMGLDPDPQDNRAEDSERETADPFN